jgi:MFS family permease
MFTSVAMRRSAAEILVSRAVCGFSIGIVFAVCPMYVAEVAENGVRGILGTTFSTA